ncbi:Fe-S cluster assembly protein SufB [Candidatus Woesearchaeota archaeon]|nr:Fe-S cluster assembly protein SufB [Candidatus Woesearchaeota archaeon]
MAATDAELREQLSSRINRDIFDHSDTITYAEIAEEGINEQVVRQISEQKDEPTWMLKKRLQALKFFHELPTPTWGPDLSKLDLAKIIYFARPDAKMSRNWEEVPAEIKRTFDKLGIPEAERRSLAGAGAQYDSEIVYHNLKKEWEDKGVIFEDCDFALKHYPELMKKYFMTSCVPNNDHKFAALHGAVWSGGTFLFVPAGVKVGLALQAYFRMNAYKGGQFEHTLIIIEEDAQAHYIEGCSAPQFAGINSLHAGCVEVYVKPRARFRYSSVENWSKNTYNLNTKRAIVEEDGYMEWVGGNMGSGVTMLYPCSILKGARSRADHLAIAFAGKGQNQDTGAKVFHLAPNTTSLITSKSISFDGGVTSYRGHLQINKGARKAKSSVQCDALMLDAVSKSNTYPFMLINEDEVDVGHEASVGRISPEQIFYLMSRGLSEEKAKQMIVSGFMEPIIKELPLEYAVEMNRLIQLEMEGSLG